MSILGPNTNAPARLLAERCILCVGEDGDGLWPAVHHCVRGRELQSFRYRCFEFRRFEELTVVLAPMGTGCLEPLMWELLSPGVIDRIVLIGTAGAMPTASVRIGDNYIIHEAYSAGTALDGERIALPLRPSWNIPAGYKTASSVSTDFFYGFSDRVLDGSYPLRSGGLEAGFRRYRDKVQLVEMEVAPFYCFCGRFSRGRSLGYLAVKGVSNVLGVHGPQVENSPRVVATCMATAIDIIGGSR